MRCLSINSACNLLTSQPGCARVRNIASACHATAAATARSRSSGPLLRLLKLAVMPDCQKARVTTERLMIRTAKRVGLHFGNWLVEVVDLLHGISDLLWIGADLIARIQQKPHAVVGLCGSNRVKVAAVILKHALYLFVQRSGILAMFRRI